MERHQRTHGDQDDRRAGDPIVVIGLSDTGHPV
jgi:hypothetical protein